MGNVDRGDKIFVIDTKVLVAYFNPFYYHYIGGLNEMCHLLPSFNIETR